MDPRSIVCKLGSCNCPQGIYGIHLPGPRTPPNEDATAPVKEKKGVKWSDRPYSIIPRKPTPPPSIIPSTASTPKAPEPVISVKPPMASKRVQDHTQKTGAGDSEPTSQKALQSVVPKPESYRPTRKAGEQEQASIQRITAGRSEPTIQTPTESVIPKPRIHRVPKKAGKQNQDSTRQMSAERSEPITQPPSETVIPKPKNYRVPRKKPPYALTPSTTRPAQASGPSTPKLPSVVTPSCLELSQAPQSMSKPKRCPRCDQSDPALCSFIRKKHREAYIFTVRAQRSRKQEDYLSHPQRYFRGEELNRVRGKIEDHKEALRAGDEQAIERTYWEWVSMCKLFPTPKQSVDLPDHLKEPTSPLEGPGASMSRPKKGC